MKSIIFSTPEVQTILDGRKTQTLEAMRPQTSASYQQGDILWVKEAWARISDWPDCDPSVGLPDGYIYKTDWKNVEHPKWRLAVYMPREAARIFLRVTDVTPKYQWMWEYTLERCENG